MRGPVATIRDELTMMMQGKREDGQSLTGGLVRVFIQQFSVFK